MTSVTDNAWALIEEMIDRGDPGLVAAIRDYHDADRLGAFAPVWYNDRRPASRRLLLAYLDQPLNAPRHEALVKRLFKLAEAAEDDEVMGRFLVLMDRSVRRMRRKVRHWIKREIVEGEVAVTSGGEMPRGDAGQFSNLNEYQRERYASLRLFSVTTRSYLRRRAWRYFRKIGKVNSARYFAAVRQILPRYTDADIADGLALLDNWGLVHILFHHSEALESNPTGWTVAEGHALADVTAAPIFPEVWAEDPAPLLELLDTAQAKTVRHWAIQMLRREHEGALEKVSVEQLITWLGHRSPEMVNLAAELLESGKHMKKLGADRLLQLVATAAPETLKILCKLAASGLDPRQVTIRQAVDLAKQRTEEVARLGLKLLEGKKPRTEEEAEAVLELADAECDKVRMELVRWVREALSGSKHFTPEWVVGLLDSRFEEVRAEGWEWLEAEDRVKDDVHVWAQLLESPYDTIRIRTVEHLEERVKAGPAAGIAEGMSPELMRYLWASVLLNVARGAHAKPAVIGQVVQRLEARPEEAEVLLPILGVAMRSLRGPEFRAGLVAVVQFARQHPEANGLVQRLFPELRRNAATV